MDSFWELVRSSEESSISCSMTLTPIYSPRAYRERDCSHSNLLTDPREWWSVRHKSDRFVEKKRNDGY